MTRQPGMRQLAEFVSATPACSVLSSGMESGGWWLKFAIDIEHPLAWNVVQEFGHVLNLLSVYERLPTVFYTVSPPTYMNGGPADYLTWVIECRNLDFTPSLTAEYLEGTLPHPVGDPSRWTNHEDP